MRITLGSLVLALAACAAPIQSGGVDVQPGAAERLAITCRWRHGDVGRDGCGAPEARAAKVRRIAPTEPALRGALAIGRPGDYVLENDEVVFVVDQLGRGTGFAESGGNVVDAADARAKVDELGQVFTYFGTFPRQAVYEKLETGQDAEGTAWIAVAGHELYEAKLAVRTRYALKPGARSLEITTELENRGEGALAPIDLGDAVQWGSAEKVAYGKPTNFSGDQEGGIVGAIGKRVAYAIAPTAIACDGCPKTPGFSSRNGTAWTNASYAKGVVLGPGKKARYERALVVGARGDGASLAAELYYSIGAGSPGGVAFDLVDARGASTRPGEGRVVLEARNEGAIDVAPLFFRAAAPGADEIGGELPPGSYRARFEGGGRKSEAAVFDVKAGAIAKVRLALADGARLRIVATEEGKPVPAKIQVFDATTKAPAFAPELAIAGRVDAGVAPGRYRVVASRGPEYALAEATVEVAARASLDVPLVLRRVVDTTGYIGCDLHQHTSWSADSGVTIAERVLSNAAEGVECAVASEHNQVVDFAPVVKELGLETFFRSIPGDEITTDASRVPFGHANVFPLVPRADDPRGGALPVRDRTAHEVFEAVRALPGSPLVQINHPRAPNRIGYFNELHFDREKGVGDGAGYDPGFDAIEVWSGRHARHRDEVLADLWALLKTGHPVTPTANTDTHGIVNQEAGYPRTYVHVSNDDPRSLDPAAMVEGLRVRRDVVLTNGPFLTLRGRDVHPGALVSLDAGAPRTITVVVERAPWVDATELVVVANGVASEPVPLGEPRTTPRGALVQEVAVDLSRAPRPGAAPRFSRTRAGIAVALGADGFVAFEVRGHRPLEPVLSGAPDEIEPFAMTSPVWIDVDGDGKSLRR